MTFLFLKQKEGMGYSHPVRFTRTERCDESIRKLPYLVGLVQLRLPDNSGGYCLKMADRTLRLLGFDETAVRNASSEPRPA